MMELLIPQDLRWNRKKYNADQEKVCCVSGIASPFKSKESGPKIS